jgi:hypothetical protein
MHNPRTNLKDDYKDHEQKPSTLIEFFRGLFTLVAKNSKTVA